MKLKYILYLVLTCVSCSVENNETIEVNHSNEYVLVGSSFDIEKEINILKDSIKLYENGSIHYIPFFFNNSNLDDEFFYGGLEHIEISYRELLINSIIDTSLLLKLIMSDAYKVLPDTIGKNIKYMPNWNVSNNELAKFRLDILQEDTLVSLEPIKENYKRIDSIQVWDTILVREFRESADGGYSNYYYKNSVLEKVIRRDFGESSRSLTEYYLSDNLLSFVYNQIYEYNVPYYVDSLFYVNNGVDGELFDEEKYKIIEFKSYFKGGFLINESNNLDSTNSTDYKKIQYSESDLLGEINRLFD
jgi:hypothetical protein